MGVDATARFRRYLCLFLGVIMALSAGMAGAAAEEDYTTWGHSALIRFNTTSAVSAGSAASAGANIPGNTQKFPLLVRIGAAMPIAGAIFSQSLAAGADIRFSDPDGTHLDFQIERYDAAAGQAEIWVLVPQIDGNSDKDYIKIHWGKSGAAWLSDGSKVFRRDLSYEGVWHLGEASMQTRSNSVGAFNHAVPKYYLGNERVAGVIGMADSLGGSVSGSGGPLGGPAGPGPGGPAGPGTVISGSYLDVGAGFADVASKGFTFSVWAYASEPGDFARFFDFGAGESIDNILLARLGSTDDFYYEAYNVSKPTVRFSAAHGIEEKKWMFLAVTQSGGNVSLYKNGALLQAFKTDVIPRNVTRTRNYLGRSNWSKDAYFKGKLDDPQVSLTARSADWIRLNFENQNPASNKLIAWASPPVVKLAITAQPSPATRAERDSVSLSVSAVSSESITYAWFKNGIAMPGANGPTLSFASLSLQDAGKYKCAAMDKSDTVASREVEVKVLEDYSTWSHAQRIFFNTTATGAAVDSDVADFPLLVRLDADRLDFLQAGEGGKDLRFSDADGAPLPFQIERWDAAASRAEAWVRVPRIDGNSDKDFISFHWGKSTAVSASRGDSVFSRSNGFLSCYNLNETSGAALDAVSPPSNGGDGPATRGVPGIIGNAYRFAGGNTYVNIPEKRLSGAAAFTVSLWAKEVTPFSGVNPEPRTTLIGMSPAGATSGGFAIISEDRMLGAVSGFRADGETLLATLIPLPAAWHHIAATYDGREFRLYDAGAVAVAHAADGIKAADLGLSIGALQTGGGTWAANFVGDIDAVQVSKEARGPAWIKLAYQSQREGSGLLSFGAPTENTLPAPVPDPPAGAYFGPVSVRLTCAAENSSVFYTLDGSAPDTLAIGSTFLASGGIALVKSTMLKARAYRDGKAGPVLAAAYAITALPGPGGDSLFPGGRMNLDRTHAIVFPSQESRAPVLVSLGAAWDPPPHGFDKLGPLFTVSPTDTSAAFPGLMITGDSGADAGIQLYRREGGNGGKDLWMPPKDGMLWVPSAGGYFWGRDIEPPRIRYAGSDPLGADSLRVFFAIEDNVANLRCRLRVYGGSGGNTNPAWRHFASGEILSFGLPLPDDPGFPLELGMDATDESGTSHYPAGTGRRYSLERDLGSLSAPVSLRSGVHWKLVGMPMIPKAPLTVGELASESGSGKLVGVYWRTRSGAEGDYEWYGAKDALPAGKAFWLAAEKAAPNLVFPPSKSIPSDSDGLFPIPLKGGWNLVTCPSFRALAWPVSDKDGESYLRSPLKGLRGFDGAGYTHADSLRPWEGYYVWYQGGDTVVRVGPGLARIGVTGESAKRGAGIGSAYGGAQRETGGAPPMTGGLRLAFRDGAERLELGAAGYARKGLGIEDERLPPSLSRETGTWLVREGRRLSTDYVAWNPEAVLSWTLAAQGKPQGYPGGDRLRLETADLPEGHQAWAVSPARGMKYRLVPGAEIPLEGDDTLFIHAGTPEALAKLGDLIRGREAAGDFACALRSAAGGLVLKINLPSAARVDVRIWTANGSQAGGLKGIHAASGSHTWNWSALGPGLGAPARGVYMLEIKVDGAGWSAHRIEKFSVL